jgi:hypothetical protein
MGKLNEETYARQKHMGVIPANADLTPRPKEIPPGTRNLGRKKARDATNGNLCRVWRAHR